MFRTIFLTLFLLGSANAMATRDSLLWQGISNLGFMFKKGLKDSAQTSTLQLMTIAVDRNDHEAQALLHLMQGTLHSDKGEKQAAMIEFAKGAEIADKYNMLETANKPQFNFLYETMIPAYAQLSLLCDELGYEQKCIDYAKTGLEWTKQCNDKKIIAFPTSILMEMLVKHEGNVTVKQPEETLHTAKTKPQQLTQKASPDSTSSQQARKRSESVRTRIQYVMPESRIPITIAILLGTILLTFLIYILLLRHKRTIMKRQAVRQAEERYREGQEQERSRLAKELHDGVSNQLLAIEMKLNTDGLTPQTMQLLNESREQVRRVSHELLPPEFTHTTINQVVTAYAESMNGLNECNVSCTITPDNADWNNVSPKTALEIYRIAQEAIGNALKHAKATTISIGLHLNEDHILTLTVSDDGTTEPETSSQGIGLSTMQQRAALIGGTLTFHHFKYGKTMKLTVGIAK